MNVGQRFLRIGNDLRFIKEQEGDWMKELTIGQDEVNVAIEFVKGEIAENEAVQEATNFQSLKSAKEEKLIGLKMVKRILEESLNFYPHYKE